MGEILETNSCSTIKQEWKNACLVFRCWRGGGIFALIKSSNPLPPSNVKQSAPNSSIFMCTPTNLDMYNNSTKSTYHVLAVGNSLTPVSMRAIQNNCGPLPPLSLLNPPSGTRELKHALSSEKQIYKSRFLIKL